VTAHQTAHEPQQLKQYVKLSLMILCIGITYMIVSFFAGFTFTVHIGLLSLAAAVPILLFSNKRIAVARKVDWLTLVFFIAMFIVMRALWDTGIAQNLIAGNGLKADSVPAVMTLGVIVSQLISNVPFVELYIPLLKTANAPLPVYTALAGASTIAGNLLILGAASNVIIIQQAEKHGATITFREFARIGIPLTIAQMTVFLLWYRCVL